MFATSYRISVPQSPISLSKVELQYLRNVILASRDDSDNGITSYKVLSTLIILFHFAVHIGHMPLLPQMVQYAWLSS